MAKLSLAGFKDPKRRPRYLIWTSVVILGFAAFVVAAIGVTSGYFFCGSFCHSIQKDAVNAYDQSTHSMVACTSCHMPVNADPITFLIHKVQAGVVGAYQLATKTYNVPLNPASHLALSVAHMGDKQCTQCHTMKNRTITPSEGIIINHEVHQAKGINCTACHNTVAHNEQGLKLITKRPDTGETAAFHANFMTMTACFRCHSLTEESYSGAQFKAPGTCSTCHPANFNLRPPSHEAADFYRGGHGKMALMETDHFTGLPAEDITRPWEYGEKEEAKTEAEFPSEAAPAVEDDTAYTPGESKTLPVAPVQAVDYCATCHQIDTFCSGCHQIEMPHPEGFTTGHGDLGKSEPQVCARCHAAAGQEISATGTQFCNNCHHKAGDSSQPWLPQHPAVVKAKGAEPCFECHDPTYCAACHVRS